MARITGKTKFGNRYAALQDMPGEFHLTIQTKDRVLYDYLTQVTSKEDIEERAHKLELELYPPLVTGDADAETNVL